MTGGWAQRADAYERRRCEGVTSGGEKWRWDGGAPKGVGLGAGFGLLLDSVFAAGGGGEAETLGEPGVCLPPGAQMAFWKRLFVGALSVGGVLHDFQRIEEGVNDCRLLPVLAEHASP